MKKNYNKYVLTIDGMMCGACEAHVNNLVRKAYPNVKKVKSSARKNRTIVISEFEIDPQELTEAINKTGYIVKDIVKE